MIKKKVVERPSKARINEKGEEVGDPRPLEVPVGFKRGDDSLAVKIRQIIRSERMAQLAQESGRETFEEADDFDIPDDDQYDPESPYEVQFDPDMSSTVYRKGTMREEWPKEEVEEDGDKGKKTNKGRGS